MDTASHDPSTRHTPATPAEIARILLEVGAVELRPREPFTWASGWRSPIYCDNRITLSYPAARERITATLAHHLGEVFGEALLEGGAVAGVATAGIPQAALVAAATGRPMVYVRPEPKGHGRGRQIEGYLPPGARAVLIEDLISTGGSSIKAARALVSEAGATVVGMLATFTYGLPAAQAALAEAGLPLLALCDYDALIEVAVGMGRVTADDRAVLAAWRLDPSIWGR